MDKKAITLQQLEEALLDLSRWIRNKLAGYIAEPAAEGKSGYVLSTNGAGGRSWEPAGGLKTDESLCVHGAAADAAAVGEAIAAVQAAAENAQAAADNAQTAAETAQTAAEAVSVESIGAEKARLQFAAVLVSAAASAADGGVEGFPYRTPIELGGVTAEMTPEVVFAVTEAVSGDFAPMAETYDGGVYIYSTERIQADFIIPVILCWKKVGI